MLDRCGAVVKGNLDVDPDGLEGKGEAAYTTEGINSSKLGWKGWGGANGCPLVVVVYVEKGEPGMFVYLDSANWQSTEVEVLGRIRGQNEREVCIVKDNGEGGARQMVRAGSQGEVSWD